MMLGRKPARYDAKVSIYRLWSRKLIPIDGGQHSVVENLVCRDLRLVAISAGFVEAACFNDSDRIPGVFG